MKSTPAIFGKSAAAHDEPQAVLDAANQQPNPELVSSLARHMQRSGLDVAKMKDREIIAKKLGYKDGSQVYRFLTPDKWAGDVKKFELRLTNYLENEMRIEGGGDLIEDPKSFILPSMFAFLDHVRACGHIGVAHGPAGTGKTCACRLYAKQHSQTTLYLHLFTWTSRKEIIAAELLKRAGVKCGRGEKPAVRLARHLRDSGTMIILDNAMRMSRKARDWLRDLLDDTGVAIALVGNPEIIGQWAACDQHKRVVGLTRDVSLDLYDKQEDHNTSEATVMHLLKRHLPEASHNAAVKRQALQIIRAEGSGACGAVVMHARLAHLMLKGGKIKDAAEAFSLASTQLIQRAA